MTRTGATTLAVEPEPNQVGLEGAEDEVPQPNHVTGGLHNLLTARQQRNTCMAAEVNSCGSKVPPAIGDRYEAKDWIIMRRERRHHDFGRGSTSCIFSDAGNFGW